MWVGRHNLQSRQLLPLVSRAGHDVYLRMAGLSDARPQRVRPLPFGSDRSRGSAIITALVLAAVTAVLCAGLLSRAAQEAKLATRSLFQSVSLNLAEAGIEEGLFALNTTGCTTAGGWTVASDSTTSFVKTLTGFNLTQATGEVYVRVDAPNGSSPVVVATGVVNIPNQPRMLKQLRAATARRRPWSNGMVAKNDITFSVASSVDSYDSSLGPYNTATNRSDKATIASLSTAAGAVEVLGSSTIYGYVATGGSDPLVPLGRIYGTTSPCPQPPPPPYVDSARVRRDFAANLPDIAAPTTDPTLVNCYNLGAYSVGAMATASLPRTGDLPIRPTEPAGPDNPYRYAMSSLSVGIIGNLNINGPVDLVVSGNTSVTALGSMNVQNTASAALNLYAGGNVTLAGFSNYRNTTAASAKATIWGTSTSTQTFALTWGAAFTGTIYAPAATLNLNIAADIYGAVVANTINISGWGQFHWDSQLANTEVSGFGYRLSGWTELTDRPGSGTVFARDSRPPFAALF